MKSLQEEIKKYKQQQQQQQQNNNLKNGRTTAATTARNYKRNVRNRPKRKYKVIVFETETEEGKIMKNEATEDGKPRKEKYKKQEQINK